MYGVTFNVNDDLSIGYGHVESDKTGTSVDAEVDSIQAAYTLGGASLRLARSSADNAAYASASDSEVTVLSVGLAF